MYAISYGLFVVTARRGEKDNGCITNTVAQVTSDPNRITVAVNKSNFTCDMIRETGVFTASVIAQNATFDLFRRFGFQSGRDTDKFEGFGAVRRAENGTLIVTEGTNAWISARVEEMIDLGSHMLFIAQVEDMEVLSGEPSATYTYYQEKIKPKPEAVGKTTEGKTVWRCTICGYEYEGEELPEDFICPICKHPASDFEKVTV
jgi:flavin reductase (DIM6/NTAB) family NADH-FMN oxidoreductase RutF